ncbi:hypothetical protein AZA_89969 [Nitrospirillum viridazoti Y2]|nr:hypothetical protein AZA_89969 [Nitrospirillum amazonense Y2]
MIGQRPDGAAVGVDARGVAGDDAGGAIDQRADGGGIEHAAHAAAADAAAVGQQADGAAVADTGLTADGADIRQGADDTAGIVVDRVHAGQGSAVR